MKSSRNVMHEKFCSLVKVQNNSNTTSYCVMDDISECWGWRKKWFCYAQTNSNVWFSWCLWDFVIAKQTKYVILNGQLSCIDICDSWVTYTHGARLSMKLSSTPSFAHLKLLNTAEQSLLAPGQRPQIAQLAFCTAQPHCKWYRLTSIWAEVLLPNSCKLLTGLNLGVWHGRQGC